MKIFKNKSDNSHFISLSDVMTILMMVFMLIAIAVMRNNVRINEDAKKVVILYKDTQDKLVRELHKEFDKDIKEWDAEIDDNNISFKFKSPDVLFDRGQANLKPIFQDILKDFFPRYIAILKKDIYRDKIEEIRIEGYTDSTGLHGQSKEESYFYNMRLSQNRTREVLEFCMNLESKKDFDWLKDSITANGLSFSHLVYKKNGIEDLKRSRRVEFRVKIKFDVEEIDRRLHGKSK